MKNEMSEQAICTRHPNYRNDEPEEDDGQELRTGPFWRTEDGYMQIEDMDDVHLLNARRYAMQKAGEYLQLVAKYDRKGETMLLKMRQLTKEARNRGLLHDFEELVLQEHE